MRKLLMTLAGALGLAAAAPALATPPGAVIGAVIGGGFGAVIGGDLGGRQGAVIGGAIGAATGAAIGADAHRPHRTYRAGPRHAPVVAPVIVHRPAYRVYAPPTVVLPARPAARVVYAPGPLHRPSVIRTAPRPLHVGVDRHEPRWLHAPERRQLHKRMRHAYRHGFRDGYRSARDDLDRGPRERGRRGGRGD